MSLPAHMKQHIKPKPGWLVIEREESPSYSGAIIIPDSYRSKTTTPVAKVVKASISSDWGIEEGDLVLVGMVGKRIEFSDKTYWYLCRPPQVVAKLTREAKVVGMDEYISGRYPVYHEILEVADAMLAEPGVLK